MRVHLHIEEQHPRYNQNPVLSVNGQELKLSEQEFNDLLTDMLWAKESISKARANYFNSLAGKYHA